MVWYCRETPGSASVAGAGGNVRQTGTIEDVLTRTQDTTARHILMLMLMLMLLLMMVLIPLLLRRQALPVPQRRTLLPCHRTITSAKTRCHALPACQALPALRHLGVRPPGTPAVAIWSLLQVQS